MPTNQVSEVEKDVSVAPDADCPGLESLRDLINQEVAAVQVSVRKSVGHARRAGELFNEAKRRGVHGDWESWVEKNTPLKIRVAQQYMRIADHWDEIQAKAKGTTLLTIEGALQLIAKKAGTKKSARKRNKPEPAAEPLADSPEGNGDEKLANNYETVRRTLLAVKSILDRHNDGVVALNGDTDALERDFEDLIKSMRQTIVKKRAQDTQATGEQAIAAKSPLRSALEDKLAFDPQETGEETDDAAEIRPDAIDNAEPIDAEADTESEAEVRAADQQDDDEDGDEDDGEDRFANSYAYNDRDEDGDDDDGETA